jgi:hypothetical protein
MTAVKKKQRKKNIDKEKRIRCRKEKDEKGKKKNINKEKNESLLRKQKSRPKRGAE